ncbi:CopG family transcriptional regulator [Halococcoides cellulosivorans]|uniref:CopG family transcriptional regulator n=1 Tax=Halococcoides cellulosivorans TaxID=1679096 RepID=A0A2R4WYI6_9EURY|nr:CopG family transcriptional regulator [Halococcoides cellulosivorans]AWB26602.1 CopG family transcriptional regulator [Halococcoides cellulosivorans]
MPTRFTIVCEDERAETIATLARRHDLTEEGVLRQLLDLGLEAVENAAESQSAIER